MSLQCFRATRGKWVANISRNINSSTRQVFILGGYQTDFSRNWAREKLDVTEVMRSVVENGLEATRIDAKDVDSLHVGNFTGELFCNQGHMGSLAVSVHQDFTGKPASRHEGACASGSLAILSATAEIEANRYDLVAVLGIEQMRNVPGDVAAKFIGAPAMWAGHECLNVKYPWPHTFSLLAEEYNHRYGLNRDHLRRIGEINFANAKRNPNAQTRNWSLKDENFSDDDIANPVVDGWMRKHDCSQLSDGAAIVFLASEAAATRWAERRGVGLQDVPRIVGWGHRCDHISFASKVAASKADKFVLPQMRGAITDAFRRANLPAETGVQALDGVEVHDCFTSTEYAAIDHLGLTAPGESWKAIENGTIEFGGKLPINPSGGLMGLGHPVGATGVRMLLDAYKQVSGLAGDYQVSGANRFATLNLGGSAATTVCFIVENSKAKA